MTEKYKDIINYEGLYMVGNMGHIKSLISNKILKNTMSSTGYCHVQLYKDKHVSTVLVHRLVAEAFVDNVAGCNEINHKDGNKTNNEASNLEWVTRSDNQKHAINLGLRPPSPRCIDTKHSKKGRIILQYDKDGSFIQKWDSISEAAAFYNVCYSSISCCVNGWSKTSCGFIWMPYLGGTIKQIIEVDLQKVSPNKAKTQSRKRNRSCKKIQQITTDGKLVKTWDNYKILEFETGYNNGNIYKCISGKLKLAYGYVWKYEDTIT